MGEIKEEWRREKERGKAWIVDAGVRRTALETPMRRNRREKKNSTGRGRMAQEREGGRERDCIKKEFTTRE